MFQLDQARNMTDTEKKNDKQGHFVHASTRNNQSKEH